MFRRYKLIYLFILIVVAISIYNHQTPDWLIYYNVPVGTLSYVAVIITALFIGYQAKLFLRDYKNKNERAEFELSYKMANYYSDEIIQNMAPIKSFLKEINMKIDKKYNDNFLSYEKFTAAEARHYFPDAEGSTVIDKFNDLFLKPIPQDKLIRFFSFLERKSRLEIKKEWDLLLEGKSDEEIRDFYIDKSIEFHKNLVDLFNKLEYFSMFFCSGLAIPENVYMSLHQTFLEFLREGYLFICSMNQAPGHEYYMHTIKLFNKWQNTFIENEKRRQAHLKKYEADMESESQVCWPKKINQD